MTGPRRTAALGGGLALLALTGWIRRTHAAAGERRRALPGDELVPSPMWQATRAITIGARPAQVWPWLVQMGFPTHRAGWYTPAWLDRVVFGIRERSAARIVPELQALEVGDRVPDSDSGASYFTAARVEPPHALVLLSHTHPLPMYRDVDFSWAFVATDDAGGTRLIMRARVTYTPVWHPALVRWIIAIAFGAGDVVQAGGMLHGIRRRAEGRTH
ncbi:MAG: SRPBCC family protein [Thermoleophilia bacterium]|nr:SRPBCC family protein [Thermoleophilia bacterium]